MLVFGVCCFIMQGGKGEKEEVYVHPQSEQVIDVLSKVLPEDIH
jgi:hypothetical protein